eukprot:UN09186
MRNISKIHTILKRGELYKHKEFGLYLLWTQPIPKRPLLSHLDGRSYMPMQKRVDLGRRVTEHEKHGVKQTNQFFSNRCHR